MAEASSSVVPDQQQQQQHPPRQQQQQQAVVPKSSSTTSGGGGLVPSGSAASGEAPSSSSADVNNSNNISYSAERIIGNGSFGVVFEAKVVGTGEVVAIKKVLQDKRFKNRELQIMRQLVKDPHTNIVALQHCFYSQVRK